MADKTGIEWTDATWNPVTGCAKVSQGCKNCYALRDWPRMSANPKTVYYGRAFTDVQCHPERLGQPIRWKRPRRVFVNSMSDLFHESVPDDFIDRVFTVTAIAQEHTFQVLTKRPQRMRDYLNRLQSRASDISDLAVRVLDGYYWSDPDGITDQVLDRIESGPLANVWMGVSVEDQKTAEERVPLLIDSPAAIRWISAEPLLGAVDLTPYLPALDWVVVGGESGTKARPMHPQWAVQIQQQCQATGVPFLFKQWGQWAPTTAVPGGDLGGDMRRDLVRIVKPEGENDGHFRAGDVMMRKVGKKSSGRELLGALHDGYPGTERVQNG